jgi:hypothetical protein
MKTTTYYLAVDLQSSELVSVTPHTHWADAQLAAITDARGEFRRDDAGFLQAYDQNGKPFPHWLALGNDAEAKHRIGQVMEPDHPRYSWVEIRVDADGYLVCGDDENELLDAVAYGRAAGFLLRNADAERADVDGDE